MHLSFSVHSACFTFGRQYVSLFVNLKKLYLPALSYFEILKGRLITLQAHVQSFSAASARNEELNLAAFRSKFILFVWPCAFCRFDLVLSFKVFAVAYILQLAVSRPFHFPELLTVL